MFTNVRKSLLGALTVIAGVAMASSAQAQRYYSAQRPVYSDNGGTRSIVTQTPMGPVRSSRTVDPRTGEEVSTTYWRDPRTGQVTTSRRVVDPRTGEDRASTRTVDPATGAVQRSRVDQDRYSGYYSQKTSGVDPWSGMPYRSRSTYDPRYGETYQHQDPYYGGSRVEIPYRVYRPYYR